MSDTELTPPNTFGHDQAETSRLQSSGDEGGAYGDIDVNPENSDDPHAMFRPPSVASSPTRDNDAEPPSDEAETLALDDEHAASISPKAGVSGGLKASQEQANLIRPEVIPESDGLHVDASQFVMFREPGTGESENPSHGSSGPDSQITFARSLPTVQHQPVVQQAGDPNSGQDTVLKMPVALTNQRQKPLPESSYGARQTSSASGAAKARKHRSGRRVKGIHPGCLWLVIALFVTACGGLTLTSVAGAALLVPQLEQQWSQQVALVDDYQSFASTFFYDRNGELLYEAFGEGRRTRVPFSQFPDNLIDATIAIEDDSYFENIGIDLAATVVAGLQFIGASPDEQTPGGSTITQQVVRNVLFDFEKRSTRSIQRKAEEIILAILLTQQKSKEEILELYLNEIYYGNLAYGAQTAAQTFFGKDVANLSLGEAALLAGLPQAPASLDPLNPDPEVQEAVLNRWRQVLGEMVEEGFITTSQRDQALQDGLNFVLPASSLQAPHFTVYAQGEFERLMLQLGFSPEDITRGGMKVYTTIAQDVNDLALQSAQNQVATLRANNVSNAAVVVTKPLTGEIIAMVGSIDYNSEVIDGRVNVTTAFRQPGSTMKPFTYTAAMERGMTAADVIWDTRTAIGIPGQPVYTPRNYDGGFHGPMTMRYALANSYNVPAVQTLRLIGVDALLELMQRFGVESLSDDATQYGLSLTLGGGEITLVELVNAYSVFANLGSYVEVTSILCVVDGNGSIVYQYENSCPEGRITSQTVDRAGFGRQVLDPRLAYTINDILSDNNARSPAMGANSPLNTGSINTAVKTGTTNDVKDNWTVGYTGNVAVGVWVGNNDGQPMVNSSGLTGAAPIWNAVMRGIHTDNSLLESFIVGGQLVPDQSSPPYGLSLHQICDPRQLKDPSTSCPSTVDEWLLDGPPSVPDAEGNLQYLQGQQRPVPDSRSYLNEVSPGIYSTVVFPIPLPIASGIQFQLAPGDIQPLAPKYCRVPVELIQSAPGAQELVFVAGPATSQPDAVEAEKYARQNGIAFLPTIDCWPEVFASAHQNFGPTVVTAIITSPSPYQTVTENMPIIGTVQFAPGQVQFYKIELVGGPFTDWTTLGNVQTSPSANGQLEMLHAEGLPPGNYQLRLVLVGNNNEILQQPYVVPFTKP